MISWVSRSRPAAAASAARCLATDSQWAPGIGAAGAGGAAAGVSGTACIASTGADGGEGGGGRRADSIGGSSSGAGWLGTAAVSDTDWTVVAAGAADSAIGALADAMEAVCGTAFTSCTERARFAVPLGAADGAVVAGACAALAGGGFRTGIAALAGCDTGVAATDRAGTALASRGGICGGILVTAGGAGTTAAGGGEAVSATSTGGCTLVTGRCFARTVATASDSGRTLAGCC